MDFAHQKQPVWHSDRFCKAHFLICTENRTGSVHSPDGSAAVRGGFYLCRGGKCSEKRFGERCINGIGGGRPAYHDFVGVAWLELLQAFA